MGFGMANQQKNSKLPLRSTMLMIFEEYFAVGTHLLYKFDLASDLDLSAQEKRRIFKGINSCLSD